jgi:hypothetical protein
MRSFNINLIDACQLDCSSHYRAAGPSIFMWNSPTCTRVAFAEEPIGLFTAGKADERVETVAASFKVTSESGS